MAKGDRNYHTSRPFAWDSGIRTTGGHTQRILTMKCSRENCGNIQERVQVGHLNPEHAIKYFQNKGWKTDGYNRSKTVCPQCQQAEAKARKLKPTERTATVIPFTPAAPAAEPKKEETMQQSPTSKPPGAGVQPRTMTQAERIKIRDLLDEHFGDDGIYRNGYNDQRIGAEVNVPWLVVKDMREIAYGPIKQDPAITALESELLDIKDAINGKVGALGTIEQRVTAALGQLQELKKRYA